MGLLFAARTPIAWAQGADPTAQNPPEVDLAGELASRIVDRFDFNEPENADPVPLYWVRIADPGFPDWNDATLFPELGESASEDRCVRLPTHGGHAGLRLVAGVIPVIPAIDYHLRVRVRTDGLRRSRARVVAYFVDDGGQRVPAPVGSSPLIETGGEWRETQVVLRGLDPGLPRRSADDSPAGAPAWIQIEFLVEQPSAWTGAEAAGPRVLLEDVRGAAAYFDDLTVWRVPRIDLSSSESTGVFIDPARPMLVLRAQDVASAELETTIRTYNHRSELVAEQTLRLSNDWQPAAFRPDLPALGWYRTIANVSEAGREIARAWIDYAWMPALDRKAEHPRFEGFGVVAEDLPSEEWSPLPDLLARLGADSVSLPLWPEDLTRRGIRDHRLVLEPTIARLNRDSRGVAFVLGALPAELAVQEHANPSLVYEVFGQDQDRVWRYLEEFQVAFGQTVKRWQFGPTTAFGSGRAEAHPQRLATILHRLAALIPSPQALLPWSIDRPSQAAILHEAAPDARRPAAEALSAQVSRGPVHFSVFVGNDLAPESLPEHLSPWREGGLSSTVVLEAAPAELYGLAHRVDDLVRRAILAREGGASELAIERPWRTSPFSADTTFPEALFPAWRTVASHLDGREARSRLDLGRDVTAIVFSDEEGEGTIAVWHDSPDVDVVAASIFLGNRSIRLTDAFGNAEEIPLADGVHQIRITRSPRFIDGAVINLALLRSGFSVTPRWIEGAAAVHTHEMILKNPWKTSIAGTLRIVEPASWDIRQRIRPFSIGGGEEVRLPLIFTYPAYETGGAKRFVVDIELQNISTGAVRMESIVELGFRRVTLTPHHEYIITPDGLEELVVTLEIANNSDAPVWLSAMVLAEGYGRLELDVAQLDPGEMAVRVFRLPDPAARLLNPLMRVGLRERGGPGRFNLLLDAKRPGPTGAAAGP